MIFLSFLVYLSLVVRKFYKNIKVYNYLIDLILIGSVFSAVLGLYEFFSYSLFGKSKTMLIPYLLPPDSSFRVGGVYGQPNLYAVFLTVSILAFFWKYIHSAHDLSIKKTKIFRFIPLVLVSVVFFLTGSRSGFLSLFFVLIYLLWMVSKGKYLCRDFKKKKEFFKISFFVIFSFFIAQILIFFFSSGALNRALNITGVSIEARFVFWTSAVLMFVDNLITGIGLGNYKFLMNSYGPKSYSLLGFVQYEAMGSSSWAHNEFLQLSCEGGIFVFFILLILLIIFFVKLFKILFTNKTQCSPIFLYSHLWLLPFIIQSMFSWTLRSPPLLFLFFTLLGGLLSQYPLKRIDISPALRGFILCLSVGSLIIIGIFFIQELKIEKFKKQLITSVGLENTFGEFAQLAADPYSEYRVLSGSLNRYARESLKNNDLVMVEKLIPYYERLCELKGMRWYWFDLAHLYLKLNREDESRFAIKQAIHLMPLEQKYWDFLHYLNVLVASRETGRPISSFYPQKVDFSLKEMTGILDD